MQDISDLSDTIIPKSDQLNADDLLSGPRIITINNVKRGGKDDPVVVGYEGDTGRPYKPCKTMRKLLIYAYGSDGANWIGKQLQLYCDPSVKWAGKEVGGIRISHMSHIEKRLTASLMVTRGSKKDYTIEPLQPIDKPVLTDEKFEAQFEKIAQSIINGKMSHEQAINKCEQKFALTDEMKQRIRSVDDEPVSQSGDLMDD